MFTPTTLLERVATPGADAIDVSAMHAQANYTATPLTVALSKFQNQKVETRKCSSQYLSTPHCDAVGSADDSSMIPDQCGVPSAA